MFVPLPVDLGQIAIDFAARAGLNVTGCRAVISTTGRMHRVEVKDGAPAPNYKLYTVMLDSQGRVCMAHNSTLTYRRAKKLDTKPLLSESERRKMLDAWVKRWPVPSGYVVTSFNPRTQYGDAELTFDRKVNGYWMGAGFTYGIDARTGMMSRFNGQYAMPGNTKLTFSRADAIKAAEAQLGPAIKKYGAHRLGFVKPMFLRRGGSDFMDLGYRISFVVKSPSDRSRFYGGAEIGIHGATGKAMGKMVMLEYKGSFGTKGS